LDIGWAQSQRQGPQVGCNEDTRRDGLDRIRLKRKSAAPEPLVLLFHFLIPLDHYSHANKKERNTGNDQQQDDDERSEPSHNASPNGERPD
jgi:hypothetical protein